MAEAVTAYIALGSNLGDRKGLLDEAIEQMRLQPGIEVVAVSTYHETDPVGGPAGQGRYLNAVAQLRTTLDAPKLLRVLQSIENRLGRVRTERNGPRTLDLDLLLFGSEVHGAGDPIVPHPRMQERDFVLAPLVEIAPLAVHPVLQSTAKDLLERLKHARQPVVARRELTGQNAVITGSTSGIGRAIALALADAGANVVIHGRRSGQVAEQVAVECRAKQVEAAVLLADLRSDEQCVNLARAAWDSLKHVDIWINNAGADVLTGEAAKWPFERKLDELWAVDVRATMFLARTIGARMKERGRGVIVNMGWDQAEQGLEGDSGQLFGVCKGAVMAFSRSLARTLAPEVRVNCLAPGWIRTAWGEHAPAHWQERVLRETPLKRWGTPEDVAQAALWLVSPSANFMTGQVIRINGGAM
jgi:2-amino-4-hydroxy-6-hydroxymethyldihydropteridine diphosphokinase